MQVTIEAPLRPTEEPARVREALTRFFPDAVVREEPGRLVGTSRDLQPLRKRVWELRIIDTFRGQFEHGAKPRLDATRSTTFRLSKQAALAGHVSFSPRAHALGDIQVTVAVEEGDARDLAQLMWWLAPETKDGEIVGPMDP